MRRTLTIILGVGVLFGIMTLGGCVSEAKYREALQANRQAERNLTLARESAETLQRVVDKLNKSLQDKYKQLEEAEQAANLSKDTYAKLKAQWDELKKLYDEELNRDTSPMAGPLPAKVHAALRALASANPDLMEYMPKYGMVKMKSDLSFPLGSAEVNAGASAALGKLATILKGDTAKDLRVYIAGHTDDVPIHAAVRKHPTNWYLSAHRAIGVQKVLVQAGLQPERIGVMGFGEYHPVAPNKPGKKGNSANRRVEIWIIPPSRVLTLPTLGSGS